MICYHIVVRLTDTSLVEKLQLNPKCTLEAAITKAQQGQEAAGSSEGGHSLRRWYP